MSEEIARLYFELNDKNKLIDDLNKEIKKIKTMNNNLRALYDEKSIEALKYRILYEEVFYRVDEQFRIEFEAACRLLKQLNKEFNYDGRQKLLRTI